MYDLAFRLVSGKPSKKRGTKGVAAGVATAGGEGGWFPFSENGMESCARGDYTRERNKERNKERGRVSGRWG